MDDMDDNMDTFCSSIKCLWKRGRWQEINSEARKGRCGDWTLVGFEYSDSVDDIEPSIDNPYYDAENEWIVSDILIYDEENTLYADYSRIGYENELRYCEQESWRETGLEHVMICTYLRKDSKEMEQKKEYQYVDEVTVSTVQELVEAIQSRTKIILKEGTYNFSELDCDSIKNPNIENKSLIKSIDIVGIWIYDEIQIERRRWTAWVIFPGKRHLPY